MSRRRFRVHPDVLDVDLRSAVDYYAGLEPSLADRLTAAFVEALRHIEAYPFASREYVPGFRRMVLLPFPYMVVYAADDESVIVAALLHGKRDPAASRAVLDTRS